MWEHLLLVGDDDAQFPVLVEHLVHAEYHVEWADSASAGLKLAYLHHPDLVIVDLMLPDREGWEICERLRDVSEVALMTLIAPDRADDVVAAYRLGVADCVRKPIIPEEVEARVRMLLNCANVRPRQGITVYDDGALKIDLEARHVWRNGRRVRLTPTEFRLITSLLRRGGSVTLAKDLMCEVWGTCDADTEKNLMYYIHLVRKKLEDNPKQPRYIHNAWGVGYYFAFNGIST